MSSPPEGIARQVRLPARLGLAFGRFWWEFLVGDTPELFVGSLVILALVALLVRAQAPQVVLVAALPVLVGALLALSLRRAWRQRRR